MACDYDVVIVGAGHAGAQAAIALRQQGFDGSIAMIGDEPELPYERPPLSKEYLAGEKAFERMLIRPAKFWDERGIAIRTGLRVTAVDAEGHAVTAGDERIGYRHLIWAAGASPRRLACPGAGLAGVQVMRSRADADALMAVRDAIRDVAVIGGGYIGLEAAAVLAKLGKQVTVIEAMPRVMARVAGEPLSRFYEGEHRAHGVDIRLDARLAGLEGTDGHVAAAVLEDGERVAADLVIVGIGIEPNVEALLQAGAAGGNGVDVDAFCRTSLPDVHAVGDCAAHANRFADGQRIRLESVQNANDQATTAARDILGDPQPYRATPWFWSNQYDLRLQTVGLSGGHDALVVRGDPAERRFSIVYMKGGRVIALDCVNAAKDFVQGRALVERGARIAPARLADVQVTLKELAAEAGA